MVVSGHYKKGTHEEALKVRLASFGYLERKYK